ncbi:MAG: ABC transporter permease [Anaerolineae bacterium]|nr:ABC transporter permease [Anaerolineae bacterium]
MIIRSLLRRRTRTLLTMVGVAIGVAAIISLGAMAQGTAAAYGDLSGGSKADLLVAQADAVDIMFSAVDEEVGRAIAGLPGVEEVTGMVYTLAATDKMPYFIVFGYDPQGFAIEHFKIVEGERLSARSTARGGREIILGRAAADGLDKRVGDTFRLYESIYRVVGIYETGAPIEDASAVVAIAEAQVISKHPRQVNAFLLKLRDLDQAERVRQRIEQRYDDVTATLSSDYAEDQMTLAFMDGFAAAVSLLAVLIGGIGVMNTFLMSIFERTREFGVLRSLGWRPARVMGLVLGEALALCGLGGLAGVGLGVGLVKLIDRLPLMSGFMSSGFSPEIFVQAIGVALALGLVGGVYPAWRAARLTPAEAMRYEGGAGGKRQEARGKRQEARRRNLASCILHLPVVRNLLRQPMRTTLTLTGVGIAMMTVVSLGGMAEGLVQQISSMMTAGGFQLTAMEAEASMDLSRIDEGVVRRIADIPGVQAAEGFLVSYATLGDLPFFVVFGYSPRGQLIREFEIVGGAPLAANRQVILGRVAAENLKKGVGDTLRIFDSSFRIVGVYETGVPFQDGGGVVALRDAQRLFGQPHKVSFMGIQLDDPLQANEVRFIGIQPDEPEQAEAMMRKIRARFPEVQVTRASEFADNVTDLQMTKASVWAIAFLALLVGGAGMMNTMVMSVFERTREIGVLRALGWRKWRVLRMVLGESLVLSLLGGLAGMAAGVGVIGLLNVSPIMQGLVISRFSAELFAQALLTALVLGAVGGVYPAWRASRLRPVEALRYE